MQAGDRTAPDASSETVLSAQVWEPKWRRHLDKSRRRKTNDLVTDDATLMMMAKTVFLERKNSGDDTYVLDGVRVARCDDMDEWVACKLDDSRTNIETIEIGGTWISSDFLGYDPRPIDARVDEPKPFVTRMVCGGQALRWFHSSFADAEQCFAMLVDGMDGGAMDVLY